MTTLRILLARRRGWFAVLLAMTLAVRFLVPIGFMPVVADGSVSLRPCPSFAPVMAMPMPMHHGVMGGHNDGKTDTQCPFAAAGLSVVGSADPVLAVVAALFALALGGAAGLTLILTPAARLRPPLRGPPLLA